MQVKSFSQLTEPERQKLYTFILSFNQYNFFSSLEEMIKRYGGTVYDYGNSHFSLWHGEEPAGSIGVVTKNAGSKGEVFVTGLNLHEAEAHNFRLLLDEVMDYCSSVDYSVMKLGIGTNKLYLAPLAAEYGFSEVYRLHIMRLGSSCGILDSVSLEEKAFEELSEGNRYDFMEVHNEAFLHSPNGGVMNDRDMAEVLEEYRDTPWLAGLYRYDVKAAAIYMLKLEGGVGWIDAIGVHPLLHGRGLGKIVLKKSIELLKTAGAETIKLTVMSSNINAHRLYLKSGFEEESIQSVWYERKK